MSMIKIENLTFSYPTSYDNVFENVSFQVDTDWKLGFVGRNGRGKTTFLNLLLGKYEYSGKILSSVQFDYFPYPVSDKNRITEDILQEICPLAEEWELMRELSYLDVDVDVLWRPFETLSNGEQTKVLIAALFLNEGHFLLIDEPTNHLDAKARKSVAAYLKKKKGFILVSHDRRFLDDCVDYILSINRANIEVQRGNFSSWMSNFERQQEFELAQNERLQKDIRRLQQSAKRAAVWSERVEASKIGAADKGYVGHKAAKMMKRSKSIEARQQQTIEQKSALLKNMETAEALKIQPLNYHTDLLASLSNVVADVTADDIRLALVPVSKKSASVYKSVNILYKSIFAAAKESKVIQDNPTIYLSGKNGGVPQKEKTPLTDDQVERLLDAIKGLPPYVFVMLGLYAGLRREEILALQWDSVFLDEAAPYLTVCRAWHTEHNRPVIMSELKTKAAHRDIPLPDCLTKCLREAKETSTSDYVVANSEGEPLSYTQFKRLWQYIVTRTVKERSYYRYENGKRVKHTVKPVLGERAAHNGKVVYSLDFEVTPHLLRHTYITNLIHASVDPKTVQYLAGHENSKITMDIYAKAKYNRPDELAGILEDTFTLWDAE